MPRQLTLTERQRRDGGMIAKTAKRYIDARDARPSRDIERGCAPIGLDAAEVCAFWRKVSRWMRRR